MIYMYCISTYTVCTVYIHIRVYVYIHKKGIILMMVLFLFCIYSMLHQPSYMCTDRAVLFLKAQFETESKECKKKDNLREQMGSFAVTDASPTTVPFKRP